MNKSKIIEDIKPVKNTKKIQVEDSFYGILQLIEIVAMSISAYVLYFSGQTLSLKIVAGVLIIGASIRASKAFVVVK